MSVDGITFAVWIGFLPVWLLWELWTLRHDERPISVIAKRRGYQFTAYVYFWCSMPFHWWVPVPWKSTAPGATAFWILQGLILIWNIVMWHRVAAAFEALAAKAEVVPDRWLLWVNLPVWYVLAGPIAALTLFPQNQFVPWGP